jgi:magnesium and cobalt transporter
MIIHHLGRLPKRNEVVVLESMRFQILRADSRRVHTLLVDQQRNLPLSATAE